MEPWIVKGKKEKKSKLSAGNGGWGETGSHKYAVTEAYPLTDSSKHQSEGLLIENTFLPIFVFFS